MGGYIILFLIVFLSSRLKNKQRGLIIMFVAITVFSGIRYGIGYDYYSYLEKIVTGKIDVKEPIPYYMMDISSRYFPFLFFLLSSIFISFFYYFGIKLKSDDYLSSVVFYLCFPFLFMGQLSVIRQGMATAVILFAISLHDRNILYKIVLIVTACLCHISAVVGILILLPWNKLSNKSLWILFILSFISGSLFIPIIGAFVGTGFLGEDGTELAMAYLNNDSVIEGRILKYVIYVLNVFILINYKKLVNLNNENKYFIGLMTLGASLCAIFSFQSTLATRLCMFFFSTSIFVVPQLFRLLGLRRLFYIVFISLLLLQIYIGSRSSRPEDRPGYSRTYPYRTLFGEYNQYL